MGLPRRPIILLFDDAGGRVAGWSNAAALGQARSVLEALTPEHINGRSFYPGSWDHWLTFISLSNQERADVI